MSEHTPLTEAMHRLAKAAYGNPDANERQIDDDWDLIHTALALPDNEREHQCSPNRCCNRCNRHFAPHVMPFDSNLTPIHCFTGSTATADTGLREAVISILKRWTCNGCFAIDHPCGKPECVYREELREAILADLLATPASTEDRADSEVSDE